MSGLEKTGGPSVEEGWRVLADFDLPSEPGRERQAMEQVAGAVAGLHLTAARLERLKTAVAEATMNAIEHGNRFQPELAVNVRVFASDEAVAVFVTDQGGDQILPEKEIPDLDEKLAGRQSPRGWGLFLIRNMVDEVRIHADQRHHTVVLKLLREKGQKGETALER